MYESARVAATVTSHERGFPVCHGSKVRPSGHLPSLRERPVGSFMAGTPAEANARAMISLMHGASLLLLILLYCLL